MVAFIVWTGLFWFRQPTGHEIFLFSRASILSMKATQPPSERVPDAFTWNKAVGAWSWQPTSIQCRSYK